MSQSSLESGPDLEQEGPEDTGNQVVATSLVHAATCRCSHGFPIVTMQRGNDDSAEEGEWFSQLALGAGSQAKADRWEMARRSAPVNVRMPV